MNADLHRAIRATWVAAGLDWEFQQRRDAADRTQTALHDGEAPPAEKLPYCIFEVMPGTTINRHTGHSIHEQHEIRDVPVEFHIHANTRRGGASPKATAVTLADAVMQKFGGHPTVRPAAISLANGKHLLTQYQNDYGIKSGEEEYEWRISYVFRLDVPVAK